MSEDAPLLVVFDTNVFFGDVHADRAWLRSVLDDALPARTFELFVPEVVLAELDKQFGARSTDAIKEINKALGDKSKELRRLGIEPPPRMEVDEEAVAGYRETLEKRLEEAGAEILPIPDDLSAAVSWAVHRRKPFKLTGEGLPDAVIWLSVLELAAGRKGEEIVLVTENTKDFAVGKGPELAQELCGDLEERGCQRDQVRLVLGLQAFVKELADRRSVEDLAKELAAEGTFNSAIEGAMMYSRIDSDALDLPIELDNDPQVVGWDPSELTVSSAAEVPGERLVVECRARASVQLDLLIFKADYWSASDEQTAGLSISDPDFNRHYTEAQTDVELDVELTITSDKDGSDAEVEVGEASLAPLEHLVRSLRTADGVDELLEELRPELEGKTVGGFVPTERLESDVEEASVNRAYPGGTAKLVDVPDADEGRYLCQLEAAVEADVEWSSSAPSPFDVDYYKGLVENAESDAPILQGLDTRTPLTVQLGAAWDPERGWHDVEVALVEMNDAEMKRRAARLSIVEERHWGIDEED